jgi:hypothetical protein
MGCIVAGLNGLLGVASLICVIAGTSWLTGKNQVGGAVLVLAGMVGSSFTIFHCVLENVILAIRDGKSEDPREDRRASGT